MIERICHANARALGVLLRTTVQGGRKVNRAPDELRADCVEALYGRGWGLFVAKSALEMDQRIATGIKARAGGLGWDIQEAQSALRAGRDALTELKRIRGLTKRRPAEEAELLATVREKFAKAEAAQARYTATH